VAEHADPHAVPVEKPPVHQASGPGGYLHPLGGCDSLKTSSLLSTLAGGMAQVPACSGSDDHHGTLVIGVALAACHGGAAATVVPVLGVAAGDRGDNWHLIFPPQPEIVGHEFWINGVDSRLYFLQDSIRFSQLCVVLSGGQIIRNIGGRDQRRV
jgi:hypothetical protein